MRLLQEIYEYAPDGIKPYLKSAYDRADLHRRRIVSKSLAAPAYLRSGRLRRSRAESSTATVAVLHFWDTRPIFEDTWVNNSEIVKHNFGVLHNDKPEDVSVDHYVSLHEVTDLPVVDELAEEVERKYDADVYDFDMDLSDVGHTKKFNYVVENLLECVEPEILDYDYVMFLPQDSFIVNNTDENIVSIFIEMLSGDASLRTEYGYDNRRSYGYIGHSIGANPDWKKFRHNAALGRGMFPIDRYPLVKEAVLRAGNRMTAERYLGENLGENCLYLRPNSSIYFSDYFIEKLTESRAETLLAHATSVDRTESLINVVKDQWAGSLHPFLGYKGEGLH